MYDVDSEIKYLKEVELRCHLTEVAVHWHSSENLNQGSKETSKDVSTVMALVDASRTRSSRR